MVTKKENQEEEDDVEETSVKSHRKQTKEIRGRNTRSINGAEMRTLHTLSSLLGMSKISDVKSSNIDQSNNKLNLSACTTPFNNVKSMTPVRITPRDNSFHTDFQRGRQNQITTSRSSQRPRNDDSERLATVRQRRDRRLNELKTNAASLKFLPMAHLPTPTTDKETNAKLQQIISEHSHENMIRKFD